MHTSYIKAELVKCNWKLNTSSKQRYHTKPGIDINGIETVYSPI